MNDEERIEEELSEQEALEKAIYGDILAHNAWDEEMTEGVKNLKVVASIRQQDEQLKHDHEIAMAEIEVKKAEIKEAKANRWSELAKGLAVGVLSATAGVMAAVIYNDGAQKMQDKNIESSINGTIPIKDGSRPETLLSKAASSIMNIGK